MAYPKIRCICGRAASSCGVDTNRCIHCRHLDPTNFIDGWIYCKQSVIGFGIWRPASEDTSPPEIVKGHHRSRSRSRSKASGSAKCSASSVNVVDTDATHDLIKDDSESSVEFVRANKRPLKKIEIANFARWVLHLPIDLIDLDRIGALLGDFGVEIIDNLRFWNQVEFNQRPKQWFVMPMKNGAGECVGYQLRYANMDLRPTTIQMEIEGKTPPNKFPAVGTKTAEGLFYGKSFDPTKPSHGFEGFADAFTAALCGVNSFGLPQVGGAIPEVAKLVHADAQTTLFIENDAKADGTHPGMATMDAALRLIEAGHAHTMCAYTPDGFKDVRKLFIDKIDEFKKNELAFEDIGRWIEESERIKPAKIERKSAKVIGVIGGDGAAEFGWGPPTLAALNQTDTARISIADMTEAIQRHVKPVESHILPAITDMPFCRRQYKVLMKNITGGCHDLDGQGGIFSVRCKCMRKCDVCREWTCRNFVDSVTWHIHKTRLDALWIIELSDKNRDNIIDRIRRQTDAKGNPGRYCCAVGPDITTILSTVPIESSTVIKCDRVTVKVAIDRLKKFARNLNLKHRNPLSKCHAWKTLERKKSDKNIGWERIGRIHPGLENIDRVMMEHGVFDYKVIRDDAEGWSAKVFRLADVEDWESFVTNLRAGDIVRPIETIKLTSDGFAIIDGDFTPIW